MNVVAAGRQKETSGSDHYPIWVQLALEEPLRNEIGD